MYRFSLLTFLRLGPLNVGWGAGLAVAADAVDSDVIIRERVQIFDDVFRVGNGRDFLPIDVGVFRLVLEDVVADVGGRGGEPLESERIGRARRQLQRGRRLGIT